MIYGYARVSTQHQNLERQLENIKTYNEDAVIFTDKFTGTKMAGREGLDALIKKVEPGDTIIFDEVSRMSRNAEEGMKLYEDMFNIGVHIVFLKDSEYNTDRYREKLNHHIALRTETGSKATDKFITIISEALTNLIIDLAKEDIYLAFQKAEGEADRIKARVKEGMIKTDKPIGRAAFAGRSIPQYKKDGSESLVWQRAKLIKDYIRKNARAFGGTMTDDQCIDCICKELERFDKKNGIRKEKAHNMSKATYYKYKKEVEAGV